MRCQSLILRSGGYWSPNKCSRDATKVVTLNQGTPREEIKIVCTQHANGLLRVVRPAGSVMVRPVAAS